MVGDISHVFEGFFIKAADLLAPLLIFFDILQLVKQERSLDVAHVVFPA